MNDTGQTPGEAMPSLTLTKLCFPRATRRAVQRGFAPLRLFSHPRVRARGLKSNIDIMPAHFVPLYSPYDYAWIPALAGMTVEVQEETSARKSTGLLGASRCAPT